MEVNARNSHNLPDPVQNKVIARANRNLWLYIIYILSVSGILFAINTALVFALVRGIEPIVEPYLWGQPVMKYALAVVPALLIFAQWHAWDLISMRRLRQTK